jgi:NADH-quinone oxidoreductase subunit H
LALIRVLILVVPILILVPGAIWWERRLLSWMQDRIGPNRVGNITFSRTSKAVPGFLKGKKFRLFGLLQPIADGVKLFLKEDLTPTAVDRAIYFIAPAVALFPAFALGATLPWGPAHRDGPYRWLTPISDANIGILYILAISSLGVYGVVLAGYSSNNKYSLIGGLRASAQLISYELAMGMSLASIVLATGSLRITDMVDAQEGALWGFFLPIQNWFAFTPFGLVSMIVFLVCMVAETNRAPFDLPEAENELIAGYHTEYSSMKFAVFFMGEYAAMMVFSGVLTAVFLGGYNLLPIRWDWLIANASFGKPLWLFMDSVNYWGAPLWFMGKVVFFLSCYIWLRATLPRLRYDQLMSLGWKSLLPIGVANFIVVALWIWGTRMLQESQGQTIGAVASFVALLIAGAFLMVVWKALTRVKAGEPDPMEQRTVRMVDPSKVAS